MGKRPNKCIDCQIYSPNLCDSDFCPNKLLWRRVNGINMTPPGELIASASVVIHKEIITKEEMKEIYGK